MPSVAWGRLESEMAAGLLLQGFERRGREVTGGGIGSVFELQFGRGRERGRLPEDAFQREEFLTDMAESLGGCGGVLVFVGALAFLGLRRGALTISGPRGGWEKDIPNDCCSACAGVAVEVLEIGTGVGEGQGRGRSTDSPVLYKRLTLSFVLVSKELHRRGSDQNGPPYSKNPSSWGSMGAISTTYNLPSSLNSREQLARWSPSPSFMKGPYEVFGEPSMI